MAFVPFALFQLTTAKCSAEMGCLHIPICSVPMASRPNGKALHHLRTRDADFAFLADREDGDAIIAVDNLTRADKGEVAEKGDRRAKRSATRPTSACSRSPA